MVSGGGGPTCLATAFTTRSSTKLWSGLNYLIDALPMKTVLQEVLSGSGECAAIDWTFRSVFTSLVIGLFPFTVTGLFMAVIPFLSSV